MTTEELLLKVTGDATSGVKALNSVSDSLRTVTGEGGAASLSFTKLVAGWATGQLTIDALKSGVHAVSAFLQDSIQSYAGAELAQKKLTAAIQASGRPTADVSQQYSDLAAEFQRTTTFGDDLITEMEALLTQVGNVAPGQMKRALTAATDLSEGLGIDLKQATMMVGKAFAGETGALGKYGIAIDEAKFKTEGATVVLDAITDRFGGQAAAAVDTYSGRLKQLANDWDNVKEAVGKGIVNDALLQAVLRSLSGDIADVGDNAGKSTQTLTEFLANASGNQRIADAIAIWNSWTLVIQDLEGESKALAKTVRTPGLFTAPQMPFPPGYQEALDQVAKDWERETTAQKKAKEAADHHAAALKKQAEEFEHLRQKAFGGDLIDSANQALKVIGGIGNAFQLTPAAAKGYLETFSAAIDIQRRHGAAVNNDYLAMRDQLEVVTGLNTAMIPQLSLIDRHTHALDGVTAGFIPLIKTSGEFFNVQLGWSNMLPDIWEFTDWTKEQEAEFQRLEDAARRAADAARQFGGDVATSVIGALQRGANPISAAAGALGTKFTTDLSKKLTEGSGAMFTGFLGGAVSAALPAVGPLLGPLTDKIFAAIFKSESKHVNDLRDQFLASFGGSGTGAESGFGKLAAQLAAIGPAGEQAFQRLIKASKEADFNSALAVVNGLLDQEQQKLADVAAAAEASSARHAQALDVISAKYDRQFSEIDQKRKSLSDAIGQEAEEADMGAEERLNRQALVELDAKKASLEAQRAAEVQAAADSIATTGEVANALGGVNDRLTENTDTWRTWANAAVAEAERVYRAVNAVSFGHSPGGLKEIPGMLSKAVQASSSFADDMIGHFRGVQAHVDDFGFRNAAASSAPSGHLWISGPAVPLSAELGRCRLS